MSTQQLRRLATAAEEMQLEITRLRKKVLSQRKALRGLSRAHEHLWLAIRTMNPSQEARDQLAAERRQLREDFTLMKRVYQDRKDVLKLNAAAGSAVMAFCEDDGVES